MGLVFMDKKEIREKMEEEDRVRGARSPKNRTRISPIKKGASKPPRVTARKVVPLLMTLSCENAGCSGEMHYADATGEHDGMLKYLHACNLCGVQELVADGSFPAVKYFPSEEAP